MSDRFTHDADHDPLYEDMQAQATEHALVENTDKTGSDDEEAASALLDQTPGEPGGQNHAD